MNYQSRVEEIVQSFDWPKVHAYMTQSNWVWYMGFGRVEVPTVEELQQQARELLTQALEIWQRDQYSMTVSTGGLAARVEQFKTGPRLSLSFELAQRDTSLVLTPGA